MKIHDLKKTCGDNTVRVSATVTWEDVDQPQREIYIETDTRFAQDIDCSTNTFLLAAFIPARYHGERRVLVDGHICPQLRNGIHVATQILAKWYGHLPSDPLQIEATEGFDPPLPLSRQRTASFMSGGIDSLSTLRMNREDFPLHHPGSIQDCFYIHGFDVDGYEQIESNREKSDLAISSLSTFANLAKVNLIPVYTNIRHLEGKESTPYNNYLFTMQSHSACLAAIAHAFSQRITTMMIPASDNIEELVPWGSHPLLDPCYSSSSLRIKHDGARLSRLEKVELIARWNIALQTLRSCMDPLRPSHMINCCKCEKCLRTMTELLVYGKLKECITFPMDDISSDLIQMLEPLGSRRSISPMLVITFGTAYYWRHLVEPLRELGRNDLVEVIEAKLADYDKFCKRMSRQIRWKSVSREFDRRFLAGSLAKVYRFLRNAC